MYTQYCCYHRMTNYGTNEICMNVTPRISYPVQVLIRNDVNISKMMYSIYVSYYKTGTYRS